jgi:hypothetical protein
MAKAPLKPVRYWRDLDGKSFKSSHWIRIAGVVVSAALLHHERAGTGEILYSTYFDVSESQSRLPQIIPRRRTPQLHQGTPCVVDLPLAASPFACHPCCLFIGGRRQSSAVVLAFSPIASSPGKRLPINHRPSTAAPNRNWPQNRLDMQSTESPSTCLTPR